VCVCVCACMYVCLCMYMCVYVCSVDGYVLCIYICVCMRNIKYFFQPHIHTTHTYTHTHTHIQGRIEGFSRIRGIVVKHACVSNCNFNCCIHICTHTHTRKKITHTQITQKQKVILLEKDYHFCI